MFFSARKVLLIFVVSVEDSIDRPLVMQDGSARDPHNVNECDLRSLYALFRDEAVVRKASFDKKQDGYFIQSRQLHAVGCHTYGRH